jgi:predicted metal-binding protein
VNVSQERLLNEATNEVDLNTFVQEAYELGAVEAKLIEAKSVVTAPWVRLKCQFGCGGYNAGLCCPPHTPTPQQTREVIDSYTRALLIHGRLDPDTTRMAYELEREIFLSGFYKASSFGAGPCRLCRPCNLEKCLHPREARPSMEACGIDVYATVRANGYHIQVVTDRCAERNSFGLILID